jgi:hypothetical protein
VHSAAICCAISDRNRLHPHRVTIGSLFETNADGRTPHFKQNIGAVLVNDANILIGRVDIAGNSAWGTLPASITSSTATINISCHQIAMAGIPYPRINFLTSLLPIKIKTLYYFRCAL